MADIKELISQIPIGDLAAKLGIDESTANEVVGKAIPALLGGMQANAASGGAESLEKAVENHTGELVTGGVNLDQVDTEDGQKIVSHIFGSNQDQITSALSQDGAISKALPMLAPIVMSFLAKTFSGKKSAPAQQASAESGGGIGDLLGGLLGGGGGGGIGDLLGGLGGLLGGGSK